MVPPCLLVHRGRSPGPDALHGEGVTDLVGVGVKRDPIVRRELVWILQEIHRNGLVGASSAYDENRIQRSNSQDLWIGVSRDLLIAS